MEALEEFRYISQMYRDGVVKADSYYEHCQAALKDRFDGVFPELVVLLPDISKQQVRNIKSKRGTQNHRRRYLN